MAFRNRAARSYAHDAVMIDILVSL